MSISLTTHAGLKTRALGQGTTARQSHAPIGPEQPAWSKGLEISGVLQTTLDVERVIELFAREVSSLIAHDGLRYHHPDRGLDIQIGTASRHTCSYRLVVGEQSLGELIFRRRKKFAAHETQLLEYLLCSLVYPLRNALLYREALQSANTDPLTGLNNRSALDTALRREIELARRHETSLSVVVMDIDHFKSINDTFGHTVGDNAIQAFASCAVRTTRSSDILFRYGGEEFVALLSNTGTNGALLLAERMRRAISEMQCVCGDVSFNMSISAGLSTLQADDNADTLFTRADRGLYVAKQEGRNRVRIAP